MPSLRFLALVLFLPMLQVNDPPPSSAPLLLVRATVGVSTDPARAIDARDLERYIVSILRDERIGQVVPFSSVDLKESDVADAYILDVTVEELDLAQRPRWDWSDGAYVDDNVLHVEVSLALGKMGDEDEAIAGLYDIHDYRALEFGSFSRPQSVRAAVFQAAASIEGDFLDASAQGEFGENFRRPSWPTDLLKVWNQLSPLWKAIGAFAGGLILACVLGLSFRMILLFVRLLYYIAVPRSLRPPSYLPPESD